ncbi:MAG: glycosyltransferase [Pseudomonadales bacterium]|nr:glycosyltransferase [Pseudomonadales bacterium]
MNEPLVSIITPTFNDKKTILATIDSVISQTYQNWELLVIDDCSEIEYQSFLKTIISIKDHRIKIIQRVWNGGAAVTRNRGIEVAQGDFIAFLDADDLWKKNKLEVQISTMLKNHWPLSHTSYNTFKEVGVTIGLRKAKLKSEYKDCLGKNPIGCLTAIYNCKELGKIYMPNISKRQDLGLWLRILKITPFAYGIDECLAEYRLGNPKSISGNKINAIKYQWRLYREIEKLSTLKSFNSLLKYLFIRF